MNKNSLVVAVLFSFLIIGNSWSQNPFSSAGKTSNPQQKVSNHPTQIPQASQYSTGNSLPGDKAATPPTTKAISTQDKKEHDKKAKGDWWIVICTAALVVVGVLQLFAFIRQGRTLQQTIQIMRDTEVRQLRAYISVVPHINHIGRGQMPIAQIVINNYGQTPAYGMTQFIGIGLGTSFDALPPPTPPISMSMATLCPHDHHESSIIAPILGDEQISALNSGKLTLWVNGEIKYRDIFEVERFKKYRYMIGGTVGIRGNMMCICEEGNDEN